MKMLEKYADMCICFGRFRDVYVSLTTCTYLQVDRRRGGSRGDVFSVGQLASVQGH